MRRKCLIGVVVTLVYKRRNPGKEDKAEDLRRQTGLQLRYDVGVGRTPATRSTTGSTGEGKLDRLTDPGAANRWKAAGVEPDDEDGS